MRDNIEVEEFAINLGWRFYLKEDFPGINELNDAVIIIVPQWSPKCQKIVEGISEEINALGAPVCVFDIDNFRSPEGIQKIFPDFPIIIQTPVFGFYRNKSLVKMIQGANLVEEFKKFKYE